MQNRRCLKWGKRYTSYVTGFSKCGETFSTFLWKGTKSMQVRTNCGTSSPSTSGAWRRPRGWTATVPGKTGISPTCHKWKILFTAFPVWRIPWLDKIWNLNSLLKYILNSYQLLIFTATGYHLGTDKKYKMIVDCKAPGTLSCKNILDTCSFDIFCPKLSRDIQKFSISGWTLTMKICKVH